MKHLIYIVAAMLLAACTGKTVPAGNGGEDSTMTAEEQTTEAAAYQIETDSINLVKHTAPWTYTLKGNFPTGGHAPLINAVGKWINDMMGGKYKGDMTDARKMFAFHSRRFFAEQDEETNEYMTKDSIECSNEYTVSRVWENDSLVTFNINIYWYGGGAHGSFTTHGATFRKSDGHLFGKDMLKGKRIPNAVIVSGLMKYFEIKKQSELADYLILLEGATIKNLPMPESNPYLDADGLHLVYQQYEIASYAAGLPSVTIPMKDITAYLTDEVKRCLH